MAYSLPDNFELLDDDGGLPSNFEILPDNFEIIPEETSWLDDVGQFGKNVGGAAMGLADLGANALTALPIMGAGAVKRAFGTPAEQVRKEIGEAMSMATPSNLISKMGLGDPRANQSHRYMMKPFELMQEYTEKGVEALGGGENEKLLADIGLIAAPIPFAKSAGRAIGRGLETVDPGLRRLNEEGVAGTRERLGLPDNFEIIDDGATRGTSESGPVTVSWEHPDLQGELMQPINPYDVGGHVSGYREGRTTQIDPLQAELMSRVENITEVPDVLRDITDAYRTQEFTNRASQADLFETYTNQHRSFDQYGNEPLPRELSRAEFDATVRQLASEEGTRFQMPDDMEAAYQRYRDTITEDQGGLFDRESQRAGFDAIAREEGLARLRQARNAQIAAHPDVKAANNRITKLERKIEEMREDGADMRYIQAEERKLAGAQKALETTRNRVDAETGDIDMSAYGQRVMGEQGPELNLGPGGMEVGLNAQFQTALDPNRGQRPAPVGGQFTPPMVSQQFRDITNRVPGMKQAVQAAEQAQAPAPREGNRSAGVTPAATATQGVPGLGKAAQRFIHENLTPEQVIERSLGEQDGGTGLLKRVMGSGANLTSLTRNLGQGSTLIKSIYGFWNAADGLARKAINEKIVPVEHSVHALKQADRELLAGILKGEMMNGRRATEIPTRLRKSYDRLRDGLMEAGKAVNEARVLQGLEPMTLTDYYLSSRWRGNYKMEVRNAEGKLLYFLRETSQRRLNGAKKALEKAVPGLQYSEVSPAFRGKQKTDQIEAGYMEMLKLLDPKDPRVEALKSAYEEHVAGESTPSMGMPFHAEQKGNVRGFMGDRPNRSDKQNAIELLNSQIQYMKNSYRWAEQQVANMKTAEVLSSPELRAQQPNNVKYAQEYAKNAMGFGTNADLHALESSLARGLGMDRQQVMDGLNHMRSYFYTKQLGMLNAKAMFVQFLQPLFMLPAHINMAENGLKFDPVTLLKDNIMDMRDFTSGKPMREHMAQAFQYAEDHGVLSLNILDEVRNIGQSELSRRVQNLANWNQVTAEKVGRIAAYMSAVNHLHQAGLRGDTLHRSAEAMTNRAMVDYRKLEQPMWMERLGLLGKTAGTLKTFMNNQYHQLIHYAQEAARGRVGGLATMVGLQYALAGTTGMYAVNSVADIYDDYIRKALGPKHADKGLRSALLENQNDLMAYGGLSKLTGINLAGSLSAGTVGGDSLGSIVAPFAEDILKSAGSLGSAVLSPSNPEKWRTALYENLPPVGKGIMENTDPSLTSASGVSLNPRDTTKSGVRRDTFEKALRVLGATSLRESATKERAYVAAKQEMDINTAKQELVKGYVQAQRTGDREAQKKAVEVLSRWMSPEDLGRTLTDAIVNSQQQQQMDVVQRSLPKNLNSVGNIRQYQRQEALRGPQ